MRLIEINSCNYGSTGNIMLQIAGTAKRTGAETLVCYPRSRSNAKKQSPGDLLIGNRISRNIHVRLAQLTGLNGMFSVFSTLNFLRKVDKWQPDIIHLHNLHNCYINLPLLFRYIKRKRIPTVWTLHDCWAITGKCPYFTMVKCGRWKTGCFHCPQRKGYPETLVDQSRLMWKLKKKWFTGVENMTIVTPSQWLADLVKQSYLKDYPVRVINNGIDLNIFKPAANEKITWGGKNIVLFAAFGWGVRKGLDVVIDLAGKLSDNYQVVAVGTDDNVDKVLPRNVISIHRTQNQQELAELYTAADVFANPTREEVLGMVNVEALACGTPVVTFKSGGSPECIDDTCGIVVETDDNDGMLDAIIQICESHPFDKAACIRRAQKFDGAKKYEEYLRLYERLLR